MNSKEEKELKTKAMSELNIPFVMRSAFMRFANKWGRFGLYNDNLWYEYNPLEKHQKVSMTMKEMWDMYLKHSA